MGARINSSNPIAVLAKGGWLGCSTSIPSQALNSLAGVTPKFFIQDKAFDEGSFFFFLIAPWRAYQPNTSTIGKNICSQLRACSDYLPITYPNQTASDDHEKNGRYRGYGPVVMLQEGTEANNEVLQRRYFLSGLIFLMASAALKTDISPCSTFLISSGGP